MQRRDIRYQAAVLRDHYVLLLKVFDRAGGVEFWLFPGGGREPGESVEDCLRRELREETHLEVEVSSLLFRELGSRGFAPIPFEQPLADYIEAFHARNGLARARMGSRAERFDQALAALLAPHCPDGRVRLKVGAGLIWGLALGPPSATRAA